MDDVISKISELNINGYYDKSNGYVTIWFHNNISEKSDIVAYLKADMSWDVREVATEQSEILPDQEIITIKHNNISIEEKGSTFDLLVRKMINALIENTEEDLPQPIFKMKEILDNDSYGIVMLN